MRDVLSVLLTVSCLVFATPGLSFPGAEPLVFVGWALVYRSIVTRARPWRFVAVVSFLHMLILSWSTRHISIAATVAIATLGAVYPILATYLAARAGRGRWCVRWPWSTRIAPPLAFGIGIAFAHWLRAHMPEINYPHGQPIHTFYQWPYLMAPVALGGEFLGNLLVGALAAAFVEFGRCWQTAWSERRHAVWAMLWPTLVFALSVLFLVATTPEPSFRRPLDVLLLEPGFGPFLDLPTGNDSLPFEQAMQRVVQLHQERLVDPTVAAAGPRAKDPPDLVVWPENGWIRARVDLPGRAPQLIEFHEWFVLHPRTRLLTGASLYSGKDGDQQRMGTLLIQDGGRILQHQEKMHTVPLGESLPFAGLLPKAVVETVNEWMLQTMGTAPMIQKGRPRPPMTLPSGVRLGTMLCYDNAFPAAARVQVAAGAHLLVVMSNESWFVGGAELEQMVAISVCRALETRTPVVRSTFDGVTMFVDGDGRIQERLPMTSAPSRVLRSLRISVPPGPGQMHPLASMHWLLMALSLLLVLPLFVRKW